MKIMNAAKVQYSEHEASMQLGVSVEELRELVRYHIVKDDEGAGAPPMYQSADLVLLRILARMTRPQTHVA